MARTQSWAANLLATGLAVAGWGYFLYQGVIDPLGGINTLVAAVRHFQPDAGGDRPDPVHRRAVQDEARSVTPGITLAPTVWLIICTLTAGWQKLFHSDPADRLPVACGEILGGGRRGQVLAPAKTMEEMQRVIFNDYVDAGLTAIFILVVLAMMVAGVVTIRKAIANPNKTTRETGDDLPGLQPVKA